MIMFKSAAMFGSSPRPLASAASAPRIFSNFQPFSELTQVMIFDPFTVAASDSDSESLTRSRIRLPVSRSRAPVFKVAAAGAVAVTLSRRGIETHSRVA
jgi:hypothetical protein